MSLRRSKEMKQFGGVKLVVFDHDGIIFDGSLTLLAAEFAGKDREAKEILKNLIKKGWERTPSAKINFIDEAYTEGQKLITGLTFDQILKYALKTKRKGLVPGIAEVIRALHARGYELGIITSIDERVVSLPQPSYA